jgi:hypothetical protein
MIPSAGPDRSRTLEATSHADDWRDDVHSPEIPANAIRRHDQETRAKLAPFLPPFPRGYARPALNKVMLGELIDLFSDIGMHNEFDQARDLFGRVYESGSSQLAATGSVTPVLSRVLSVRKSWLRPMTVMLRTKLPRAPWMLSAGRSVCSGFMVAPGR